MFRPRFDSDFSSACAELNQSNILHDQFHVYNMKYAFEYDNNNNNNNNNKNNNINDNKIIKIFVLIL